MAKAKKPLPKSPAPPVTKHDEVRSLEEDARKLYHIGKLYETEDLAAVGDELERLKREGFDPPAASQAAVCQVQGTIDPALDFGKKFDRSRPRGAVDALGKILREIYEQNPSISNESAWREVQNRQGEHSSVVQEVTAEEIWWRSPGGPERKPVSRNAFNARMTRIRRGGLK